MCWTSVIGQLKSIATPPTLIRRCENFRATKKMKINFRHFSCSTTLRCHGNTFGIYWSATKKKSLSKHHRSPSRALVSCILINKIMRNATWEWIGASRTGFCFHSRLLFSADNTRQQVRSNNNHTVRGESDKNKLTHSKLLCLKDGWDSFFAPFGLSRRQKGAATLKAVESESYTGGYWGRLKMADGCGMNCIKYLVFIFNFLFAVSIREFLPDPFARPSLPDRCLVSFNHLTLQDSNQIRRRLNIALSNWQ